jgi:hypothetical protein
MDQRSFMIESEGYVDTCGKIDLPKIDIYTNLKMRQNKRKGSGDKTLMIWANLNFIPEQFVYTLNMMLASMEEWTKGKSHRRLCSERIVSDASK